MVVHSAQVYIQLKPLFSRHNGIGVQFTDEPTGNLDSETSFEVMKLFQKMAYKFNQTMVIVTHDKKIAEMADRIICIKDGELSK